MAKKFIVKQRFRNHAQKVFYFLLKEWDSKVAEDFLSILQSRMEAVVENPLLGSPTESYRNLRSFSVTPHNRLFYRIEKEIVVFIMLQDTRKRRYRR